MNQALRFTAVYDHPVSVVVQVFSDGEHTVTVIVDGAANTSARAPLPPGQTIDDVADAQLAASIVQLQAQLLNS